MELPNLFSSKKLPVAADLDQYFFAIIFTSHSVQSILWHVAQSSLEIISTSRVESYFDQESLVRQTDLSLQQLGEQSENVAQTLFILPDDWVTADGLLDERKPILKRLTTQLSLKPIGFVIHSEALLQSRLAQNPAATELIVAVTEQELVVLALDHGQLAAATKVGRSENDFADVVEASARLETKAQFQTLPLKIVLVGISVGQQQLKQVEQDLLSNDWQTFASFSQQPIILVLSEHAFIQAVVFQAGAAAASSLGLEIAESKQYSPTHKVGTSGDEIGGFSPQVSQLQVSMTQEAVATSTVGPKTALGLNQDSEQKFANAYADPLQSFFTPRNETSFSDSLQTYEEKDTQVTDISHTEITQTDHVQNAVPVNKINRAIHTLPGWASKHLHFVFAGIGMGVVVVLIIGCIYLATVYKVEIALALATKIISNDVQITLDPDSSEPNSLNNTLPAERVSETFEGSQSLATTGISLVGEKTQGEIVLLNKTTSEKVFPAGTVLTSNAGKKYLLDSETKLPAAEIADQGDSEVKKFGKATAKITAQVIGAESNSAEKATFQIENFSASTYEGESDTALVGGSSREVRVVSKVDHADVLAQLEAKLLNDSKKYFEEKSGGDTYFVPTGTYKIIKAIYSDEVAAEKETVTLDLTIEVTGLSYKSQLLVPLATALLSADLPEGYQLSSKKPSILSQPSVAASDSASVKLDANISIEALPTVSDSSFINEITGKNYSSATAILRGRAELKDANIRVIPDFAKHFFRTIPTDKTKIVVQYVD